MKEIPADGKRLPQERGLVTRKELIDAARRIFARDGFELARLQDIAAAAGKTRGAFYAHFQDKEDVFFAIFEEDLHQDTEVYRQHLAQASTPEERVAVFTRTMESVIGNRDRVMLYLEFKMYAIRRPHKQKRLAELHAAMCRRGADDKLDLFPELSGLAHDKRPATAAKVGALFDGLALNRLFDPVGMDEKQMRRLIEFAVRELLS